MNDQTRIDYQLKEASQLTDAVWSALVERDAGKWQMVTNYRLNKKFQTELINFLSKAEVNSWLSGALSGGQSRSVSLPEASSMNVQRLYAYPLKGLSRAVLVGAEQMDAKASRIWKLAVSGMYNSASHTSDSSLASSVAVSLLIPDLDSESPYDLPRALSRALTAFMRLVSVQGSWLAIRRGDSLEVGAQWKAPSTLDLTLSIDEHTLLRQLNRNLTSMVVNRGDALWSEVPHKEIKSNS
jgi:hypothetical protein